MNGVDTEIQSFWGLGVPTVGRYLFGKHPECPPSHCRAQLLDQYTFRKSERLPSSVTWYIGQIQSWLLANGNLHYGERWRNWRRRWIWSYNENSPLCSPYHSSRHCLCRSLPTQFAHRRAETRQWELKIHAGVLILPPVQTRPCLLL